MIRNAFTCDLRLLGLSFAAVLVAGCTGGSAATVGPSATPSVAQATESPSAASSGFLRIEAGPLDPGRYRTTEFQPPLEFTLGSGWTALFPDDSDEIAFERDGAFLGLTRVTLVVDPVTSKQVQVPEDLIAWLAGNPALEAEPPQPVVVAGLAGSMLDAVAKRQQDMFAYPTGNLHTAASQPLRFLVLRLDGPDLTVVVMAPTGDVLADVLTLEVQAVLDSLEVLPST